MLLNRVGVAVSLVCILYSSISDASVATEFDSVSSCAPCSPSQCAIAACSANYPFLCAAGTAQGGCSATPWQASNVCTDCCNYYSCFLDCSTPCTSAQCSVCSPSVSQTMCVEGQAAGQCGSLDTWSNADGCTACCNVTACGASPVSPTPQPVSPTTASPSPSGLSCAAPCSPATCELYWCSTASPYLCVLGADEGECSSTFSGWGTQCEACCNINLCGSSPTSAPTPVPTSSPTPPPSPSTPTPTAPNTPTPPAPSPSPTSSPPTPSPSTPTRAPSTPAPAPPSNVPTAPSDCPYCTVAFCESQEKCPPAFPFQCTSGVAVGGCAAEPWANSQCAACCDVASCFFTTAVPPTTAAPSTTEAPQTPSPPSGPVTNPPILTPVPGWTNSPSDFPPPTPLPPSAPVTPTPSGACPMCSSAQCEIPGFVCGSVAPFLCLTGSGAKGCQAVPWDEAGCTSCCDFTSCLPPPPTPYPSSPWDNVPLSQNCTLNSSIAYAPNPAATPYGGIDVSAYGCLSSVSQDCCGLTPRFNWVLSTCNPDPKKRISMACNHTYGNTSRAEIYYIKAYQWNTSTQTWHNDPRSSVVASKEGDLVDLMAQNMTLTDNGYKQDWDLKFGPTTAAQETNGLGPPAMMFVLSAKQFTWSSFYLLNQITLNRGPGAEHYTDNCWSSSSGELDLIEPPFWAGIDLPHDRLYLTITANAGRCFPVQKKVGKRFQRECSDPYCCQMCACPPGFKCFGDTRYAGYAPMGCMPANGTVPSGLQSFDVDGSDTACGEYFGGVSGGADSTAYFSHDPDNNESSVIYVTVVDADGVTVMRWPSANTKSAAEVWPGIGKYNADNTLRKNPIVPVRPRPPCDDFSTPCAVFEPACDDECVILSASGVYGLDQMSGPYAAEAARDGLNWWNLFVSTNQTPGMESNQLPMYVDVPVHPVPLPFLCNESCGPVMCHEVNRCPVTAPYMCTAGDGLNGCSNVSTFWPLSPHCNSCCDVTACEVPCLANCTPAQCDQMNCNPVLTPYYCFAGPSEGGCSAEASYFPQQATCDGCCDVQSCPSS